MFNTPIGDSLTTPGIESCSSGRDSSFRAHPDFTETTEALSLRRTWDALRYCWMLPLHSNETEEDDLVYVALWLTISCIAHVRIPSYPNMGSSCFLWHAPSNFIQAQSNAKMMVHMQPYNEVTVTAASS